MSRTAESPEGKRDESAVLLQEYEGKRSLYKDFAITCMSLIQGVLKRAGVRVHSVTCREKMPDSLKDKLAKREQGYDRLDEITDLAGVRIITYFADEVDAISTIIEREFDIMPEKSVDKRKALDPDRFGYLSLHYVCTMPDRRTSLTEYSPYKGLVCEIQVRSILQHAWAEIEHDLGYKSAQGIPRLQRRRFSRLAGLLETADDDFMRIRDDLAEYAAEVKKDIAEKPSEVLLDKVSLTEFIERDEIVGRIDRQMVSSVGAFLGSTTSEEAVARHLDCLTDLDIHTVADLRAALLENEELIVGQFMYRFDEKHPPSFLKGISVFQLWPMMLYQRGRAAELVDTYEKLGMTRGSAESNARKVADAVNKALSKKERNKRAGGRSS